MKKREKENWGWELFDIIALIALIIMFILRIHQMMSFTQEIRENNKQKKSPETTATATTTPREIDRVPLDPLANHSEFPDEEVKFLAGIMQAEMENAPIESRERVGIVLLNRVRSSVYPYYNTISEVANEENAYECVRDGKVPEEPSQENLLIATRLCNLFSNETEWKRLCENRHITPKTTTQSEESIDQSEYANIILREYGRIGEWEYVMCYGESLWDPSDDPPYEEIEVNID